MGSESPLVLPAIDFSSLKPNSPEWDRVRSQVFEAIKEFGCFEAVFDKFSSENRKEVFENLKEVFELPVPAKKQYSWDKERPFHGYVGLYPESPLYEAIGIMYSDDVRNIERAANDFWPGKGNPYYCKAMHSFTVKMSELDKTVRKMILESLGLEKYMEEHMDSTYYVLRTMGYRAPKITDTVLGLNAHTDKNIITILCQNQINGVEFQTKGGDWITFQPSSPNSYVVLAGDSFDAWSNGHVRSSWHRVMMTGNEARYTAGLFSVPKPGYKVKAPEEMIDEEHPLLFKPYDHAEFLKFYITDAGQATDFPLQAYCGVLSPPNA